VQSGRPPLLDLPPCLPGDGHHRPLGERWEAREDAQELAGHADARTTRLYIRKERRIAQAEVERVQL
jgi:hypothetical protein